MIKSILDTDYYKLLMMQWIFDNISPRVEYEYTARSCQIRDQLLVNKIYNRVKNLKHLLLRNEELEYLHSTGNFDKKFLDYLSKFRFNTDLVNIVLDNELRIKIEGSWIDTILFEIPILAIINETFHENNLDNEFLNKKLASTKLYLQHTDRDFMITEFGTRRRVSAAYQEAVLQELMATNHLAGTSNVYLAMKYGIKPIGTMAHEYLMAWQAYKHPRDAQYQALRSWNKLYPNSIALTDVIGVDAFIKDFDSYLANSYRGVRQDSGDPFEFAYKIIDHYRSLGIDPITKTIVFSDNLTVDLAYQLYNKFNSVINVSFGIGTFLTGAENGLNNVIKMTKCNGLDVAKISDSPGKTMCLNGEYVKFLRSLYG